MVELASNVRLSTKFTVYAKLLSTWFTPRESLTSFGTNTGWCYIIRCCRRLAQPAEYPTNLVSLLLTQ